MMASISDALDLWQRYVVRIFWFICINLLFYC